MIYLKQFRRKPRYPGRNVASVSCRGSGIFTLLIYAFSSFCLPVRLAPEVFLSQRVPLVPGAMTVGCPEASCCTSRCYLDEKGVHHCVPANGRSCDCGLSSRETPASTTLAEDEAIIPASDRPMPESPLTLLTRDFTPGWQSPLLLPATPPPRS